MLVFPSVKNSRRASPGTLSVRVATPDDDFQIANLRLSVFSVLSSAGGPTTARRDMFGGNMSIDCFV
jgi:hypothetical protein